MTASNPSPVSAQSRLAGKVVFVTGAGGGIGSAVCRRLLAAGAQVGAVDVNSDAIAAVVEDGTSDRLLPIVCDAGSSESVRDAIEQTVSRFGQLNVLCNMAGGSSSADGTVTDASEDEFWRVIRLDLFGPFASCKHGIPHLIAAGGGSIINMTSIAALMGTVGRDCYTAAKGGVCSLTRSIAASYAKDGVRANAVAPGITLTPRVKAVLDSSPGVQQLAARHLLGLVEPSDVADLVGFLASDESRMITGQVLSVDAGVITS